MLIEKLSQILVVNPVMTKNILTIKKVNVLPVRISVNITRKSQKVGEYLAQSGIITTEPSQSAIYKAKFKALEKLKKEFQETLKNEEWALHFDGKKIEGVEDQVAVLTNERKEIKLGALKIQDGKASSIENAISDLLEEFTLWNSIKLIIADTTSVNTRRKGGVVALLNEMFVFVLGNL